MLLRLAMSLSMANGSTITTAEAQRMTLLNVVGLWQKIASQTSVTNGIITIRAVIFQGTYFLWKATLKRFFAV